MGPRGHQKLLVFFSQNNNFGLKTLHKETLLLTYFENEGHCGVGGLKPSVHPEGGSYKVIESKEAISRKLPRNEMHESLALIASHKVKQDRGGSFHFFKKSSASRRIVLHERQKLL